jgi:DJ-1 family protein
MLPIMPSALIPLADGVEEMEAVIIIDTLRRAEWSVTSAAVQQKTVRASRGVILIADTMWSEAALDDFDILVIPGGADGADTLSRTPEVLDSLRRFHQQNKPVAAICAGPLVLQAAGLLDDVRVTCHPGVSEQLHCTRVDERVVIDKGVITSQAPGTAFEFALAIIEYVQGAEAADRIRPPLVLPETR